MCTQVIHRTQFTLGPRFGELLPNWGKKIARLGQSCTSLRTSKTLSVPQTTVATILCHKRVKIHSTIGRTLLQCLTVHHCQLMTNCEATMRKTTSMNTSVVDHTWDKILIENVSDLEKYRWNTSYKLIEISFCLQQYLGQKGDYENRLGNSLTQGLQRLMLRRKEELTI